MAQDVKWLALDRITEAQRKQADYIVIKRHGLNRTIETGRLVEFQTRAPRGTETGMEVGLHRWRESCVVWMWVEVKRGCNTEMGAILGFQFYRSLASRLSWCEKILEVAILNLTWHLKKDESENTEKKNVRDAQSIRTILLFLKQWNVLVSHHIEYTLWLFKSHFCL